MAATEPLPKPPPDDPPAGSAAPAAEAAAPAADPGALLRPHRDPAPLKATLWLLVPLLSVVACLLLVLGAAVAGARWLLLDEAGSRWLVHRLPLVQVQGFQGALLAPDWRADRVALRWDGGRAGLLIEDLRAEGLAWRWRPDAHAWIGLQAASLRARRMVVETGPPSATRTPPPTSLALPLQLSVQRLQIETLQVDAAPTLTALAAQGLHLRSAPGSAHEVEAAEATVSGVRVQAAARLAHGAPLALSLQARLRPALEADSPRWAAVLRAEGPLAGPMQARATLRGVPRAGREAPALDARAELRLFEAWPLHTLSLATQELDLAALHVSAPQTRLAGTAELAPRVGQAPLSAELQLENTLPGRWNERRLPFSRLTADLRGDIAQPDRLEARRIELQLADAGSRAGRVSGSLQWAAHTLTVDARLEGVAPQRLDSRAAAMQLSGPVSAQLRGLPSPTGAAAPGGGGPQLAWKLDLEGVLDAAPRPVQLAMEGRASDDRLEVSSLRATTGAARAELQLLLQRAGRRDWSLATTGSLVDFDPQPWWPGEAGSSWRQGPHRLSAGWQLDVRVPGNADRLPAIELLQRLSGNGALRVSDSVLAGVPLSGQLRLGYTQAASPTTVMLQAEALAGGNRIVLDGRGDPAGTGAGDRWRAELQAGNLSTLAPLARLHPALADWVPRQGSASATLAADGRWPALRTEGTAQVNALQAGPLAVAQGAAQWRLDTGGDRPLNLRAQLSGLQWGAQRADHLRADVTGTWQDHRIDLGGALPVQPPDGAARLLGLARASGTRGRLLAQGGWRPEAGGGGRWTARVERLLVGAWEGGREDIAPAATWVQGSGLRGELQFAPDGRLVGLQADAGRMQLAGDVALRWDTVRADWRSERPALQLKADVEPFRLAPLLARLQPAMGWAGDLRLAARVDIRAAETLDADLVFERRDGDLHLQQAEGMLLLGLTEARLALAVHQGLWVATPVFKGRSLGEITGTVRVQSTPERRWPHPEATLEGSVQARVADIGIWNAWVPPGWRLAGELRTTAALSGRFGEPRYTGEVSGSGLAVRNLLQGVNVSDGQVRVRLDGDRALIERFTLKGGDGTLTVSGEGRLLDRQQPEARLQIQAERFRLLGRVDRMAIVSGRTELAYAGDAVRVEGRLAIDEGLYDASRSDAPTLDDDVVVGRSAEPGARADEARAAAPRRNLTLALEVDAGDKLRVRGRGLDTLLRGSVRIGNPGGRLAVNGTIRAEDGTYAGYGQKLDLERGIIAFGGPVDDPRLDILALRANTDMRVGLAITGTALNPRVRLYSEPDMSETEKLSWLILGRAPDGLGRNDTALLQRAAVALLSGEGEAPTDALMRNLGIDELTLKQSDGDVRETVISLGKQLSRRWYLGYERGVNATTGTWQLIYRIAQRFTLRAQSGLENSLDVIWTWRFQETPPDAAMRKSTATPPP